MARRTMLGLAAALMLAGAAGAALPDAVHTPTQASAIRLPIATD